MANAIGTGVNVPDFRHITHHSLFQMKLESNIFDVKETIVEHGNNRGRS